MAECRHGVKFKSVHVWNDACERCVEEHAAYERQSAVIGGRETKLHREGHYSDKDESGMHTRPSGFSRTRRSGGWTPKWFTYNQGAYRPKWGEIVGRDSPEGTVEKDEEVRYYVRPGWLAHTVERWGYKFTPNQLEALELVYGEGLNSKQAAERAVCSHAAMRRRVMLARRKVRKVPDWEAEAGPWRE
jgi:predicted DNA-binding protein (UPF0251 family)